MTKAKIKIGVAVLLAAAVTGCATFKSSKVAPTGSPKISQRNGIVYFLPLARLNIKATLGGSSSGEKAAAGTPASINNVVSVVVNSGPKDAGDTNKPAVSGGDSVKSAKTYTITIKEVYEPDPQQMFLLRPQFSSLSADTYRVGVSNGLLTVINSTNSDKTGDILIDLAKIGIESFKLAVGFPLPARAQGADRETTPQEFDLTFDPTDPEELAAAKVLVTNSHSGLTLDMITTNVPGNYGRGWTTLNSTDNCEEFDGFFYRPALPYVVQISTKDGSAIRKTVFLPNEAPIVSYSPKRSAMVERVTSISLENGILKEVYVSKPSAIAAATKVPLSILQSVAALPTDLIQLKVNYNSAAKNLADSERAELDSMRALLAAQQAFLAAQTNATSK